MFFFSVAFVIIPQGLSYASLANLSPVSGLCTAFAPVLMYSLLGTSRQLSIGPEALVSMLVGSTISKAVPISQSVSNTFSLEERTQVASTLTLLVGMFTLLLGIFRFGFIDSMLSRALLRGFITAVACIIMIEQGPILLGLSLKVPPEDVPIPDLSPHALSFRHHRWLKALEAAYPSGGHELSAFDKLLRLISRANTVHWATFLVSVCSVLFLSFVRLVKKKLSLKFHWIQFIPEILILVLLSIWSSWYFSWEIRFGIRVLGSVESHGIPHPTSPALTPFSMIRTLTIPAFLISVIGFVESIVVAKQYAGKHNYPVSRNRELVALGFANLIGAVFHAYPAFGSLARSRVSDNVGSRTQLSGFITGLFVMLTLGALLPFFHHLPKAVMASIILVAAFSLFELDDIAFIIKLRAWKDMVLLLFTFCTTLFISIEAGILLSIALSLLLVVKDVAVPRITVLGRVRNNLTRLDLTSRNHSPEPQPHQRSESVATAKYISVVDFPHITECVSEDTSGVVVVRIDEPLHFANTGELRERLSRAERFGNFSAHPSEQPRRRAPLNHIVFDMRHMHQIDASAMQILSEIVTHYLSRQVQVSFVRLHPLLHQTFLRAGTLKQVGPERFVRKIADALALPPSAHT
jgi:MFS superfamily sulfate permease-like transporter